MHDCFSVGAERSAEDIDLVSMPRAPPPSRNASAPQRDENPSNEFGDSLARSPAWM